MNKNEELFLKHLDCFLSSNNPVDFFSFTYLGGDNETEDIDNVLSVQCSGIWLNLYSLNCQTHWSFSNYDADHYSDLEFRYESKVTRRHRNSVTPQNILKTEVVFEIESSELKALKFFDEQKTYFVCFMDDEIKLSAGDFEKNVIEQTIEILTHNKRDELAVFELKI